MSERSDCEHRQLGHPAYKHKQTHKHSLPPRTGVGAAQPYHGLVDAIEAAPHCDEVQADCNAKPGDPTKQIPFGAMPWNSKPPEMHQDDFNLLKRLFTFAAQFHAVMKKEGYSDPTKGWGQNKWPQCLHTHPCGEQAHCMADRLRAKFGSSRFAPDHTVGRAIRVLQGWDSLTDSNNDTNNATHSVMYVRVRNPNGSTLLAVCDPWSGHYYIITAKNLANFIGAYVDWDDVGGSATNCPAWL